MNGSDVHRLIAEKSNPESVLGIANLAEW
jgi:Ribbon-helix-helix protein, copG family